MTAIDWAQTASLFHEVPAAVVASVLASGDRRRLADGEVLLKPGSVNHHLFLLLEGSLQIRHADGATPGTIEVPPGGCVGEFSIIDGEPTSAHVVAVGACEVLAVPEERVWADLIPVPSFARNLLQVLTGRLRRAAEGQAAYERLLQELQVARQIQSSMLPSGLRMFTDHPEVGCAAAMDAAAEVGGDFFDAFFLDDRHLFFAVGDVSGKGIGAALFMARCLTLLRQEALKRRSVRDLAVRLNTALAAGNEGGPFLALFTGVLDTLSGELRFANGGLGSPLVCRGGQWERPAMPRGLVLGIFPEFDYGLGRLKLGAGDALAVFSDGVTDAAPRDWRSLRRGTPQGVSRGGRRRLGPGAGDGGPGESALACEGRAPGGRLHAVDRGTSLGGWGRPFRERRTRSRRGLTPGTMLSAMEEVRAHGRGEQESIRGNLRHGVPSRVQGRRRFGSLDRPFLTRARRGAGAGLWAHVPEPGVLDRAPSS